MKRISISLDEKLLKEVDKTAGALQITRSAFIRKALECAVKKQKTILMEAKHRKGYQLHPVSKNEFLTRDYAPWREPLELQVKSRKSKVRR